MNFQISIERVWSDERKMRIANVKYKDYEDLYKTFVSLLPYIFF